MKTLIISFAIVATSWLAMASTASAEDIATERGKQPITVGLGVIWRDQPYEDFSDSDKFKPVPLVLWEGEKFFFRANRFGYKLIDSGPWEISPIIEFEGDGYDSDNSDALDGMDDRDPWIGAGAHVIWQPGKFGVKFKATGDIAGNSDGGRVLGEGRYKTRAGSWLFNTSLGAEWVSEGYNDYYYGVDSDEVIPGVRPRFQPSDGTNGYVAGTVVYRRPTSKWMYIGFAKYNVYSDEVDDSPITSEDSMLTLGAGVAYTFGK